MDIIEESYQGDDRIKYFYHKNCFNLQVVVEENSKYKVGTSIFEAKNYEELISDREGFLVDCFECNNTILQESDRT